MAGPLYDVGDPRRERGTEGEAARRRLICRVCTKTSGADPAERPHATATRHSRLPRSHRSPSARWEDRARERRRTRRCRARRRHLLPAADWPRPRRSAALLPSQRRRVGAGARLVGRALEPLVRRHRGVLAADQRVRLREVGARASSPHHARLLRGTAPVVVSRRRPECRITSAICAMSAGFPASARRLRKSLRLRRGAHQRAARP